MFEEGGFGLIPERSIIVIEEDSGCMKDFYAQKVAADHALAGKKVCYLTSHFGEDIMAEMTKYRLPISPNLHILDHSHNPDQILPRCTGDLCVIDPFTSLFVDSDITQFRLALNRMRDASREGPSFLLVSDMGVLPEQHERLMRAMADGVIRFLAIPEGDRVKRYLYVLKMKGQIPVDKMLLFTVTDEGLQIDTRERLG